MKTSFRTLIGGVAISATAGTLPLGAQTVREGARRPIDTAQVTFGYLCDDRFVVRNEGTEPLKLEYGLAKNNERTSLDLDGRESVELMLSTSDELGLFMGNRMIASARREYRDCDDDDRSVVVHRPAVVVRPTVVISTGPRYRYYDPWFPRRVYFRPVPRPVIIHVPIVFGGRRSTPDRGRDNRRDDRGRDNRGHDNGRRRGDR